MLNKFTHTQSTLATGVRQYPSYNPKEGQSSLKNPFNQTLPLKFPKKNIIRQCPQNMLSQTFEKQPVSSVRNYPISNRSHFQQPSILLTRHETLSRSPRHHFDSPNPRRLSNSGIFGHLARQSLEGPIKMRTYADIGTVNNQKRMYPATHNRPDPIITGINEQQHNSSLERTWREKRRYRDNGLECEKAVHCNPKPKKREPYLAPAKAAPKPTTYKEMYLKTRHLK